MTADKAQKSNLQVIGEESKEVEDTIAIVDTYKVQKSNLQVVGEESEELLEDIIGIVDTDASTKSELSNEVGYGVAEIDSFTIMKDPRLDDFEKNKQADKNDMEDL